MDIGNAGDIIHWVRIGTYIFCGTPAGCIERCWRNGQSRLVTVADNLSVLGFITFVAINLKNAGLIDYKGVVTKGQVLTN